MAILIELGRWQPRKHEQPHHMVFLLESSALSHSASPDEPSPLLDTSDDLSSAGSSNSNPAPGGEGGSLSSRASNSFTALASAVPGWVGKRITPGGVGERDPPGGLGEENTLPR
jgi:hypothetical protein